MPTYNERENLEAVAGRVRAAVPSADLLVVDDDSPDGTGELADKLAAGTRTCGSCTGPARAAWARPTWPASGGRWTRATAPWWRWTPTARTSRSSCRALLAALSQADLVLGSRCVPGGRVVNWPRSRELLSRGGNTYARLMLGIQLKDATGGYRAYRASALRDIPLDEIESQGYCFQVDLARRVLRAGLRVTEVPITFVERVNGASKMSKTIVLEALLRITRWGVAARWRALRGRPAA